MELFDFPNKEIWEKRRRWIDDEMQRIEDGTDCSSHGAALFMDLQACYCLGAWLAVIVLSISVIDAHLRETEALNDKMRTAKLLDEYYRGNDDINWLRKLRNQYIHLNFDNPILEVNDQFDSRTNLETDATKAIKMVIETLSQNLSLP
jgi:hypothetical protein